MGEGYQGGTEMMIDMRWMDWCLAHVPQTFEGQLRECTRYVPMMAQDFPELTICKGVVSSADNPDNIGTGRKEYPHMWLKTKEGVIVDPTGMQFNALGKLDYREFPEGTKSLSRCMNCGKYFADSQSIICSDECAKEYNNYVAKSRYNSWG